MMNMTEAVKTLRQMYPDKYTSATIEITTSADGQTFAKCTLYVDGLNHHSGPTWEQAFIFLSAADRSEDAILQMAI